MTTPTTTSSVDLSIMEVKPGLRFPVSTLRAMLPDAETVFFFGKVYDLDHVQLSQLLYTCVQSTLASALSSGDHSTDLQGYLGDMLDDIHGVTAGEVNFDPDVPTGEILPHVWKQMEVTVAQSIKDVAAKLTDVVSMLPGKTGEMHFKSMMAFNAQRPTIGRYGAHIHHQRQQRNLLVLDVSSSIGRATIEQIVDDVVALAYEANAYLAIVSDTVTCWDPGNYDSTSVLAVAEFGGTHYEQLAPLFDQDWGVVVSVADYDSFNDARDKIAACNGSIDTLLDVSLVNKPTFLAQCLGTLASEVRPILIANTQQVLSY